VTAPAGFVGGGIGYRRAHRTALLGAGPRPAVLEVMVEHFFADPQALDALGAVYPLVFHAVGLSIGTAVADPRGDDVARQHIERVRALVGRARPLYVSDHLAFTRSPDGVDLGHLCPLPLTEAALALVSARVRLWQDALGVPMVLENIAHPFRWPEASFTEAEMLRRLTAETGCGVLLDLTNLVHDARNFGGDARAMLDELPLGSVRGVHLAGGFASAADRFWVDSHDRPVDEEALALLPALRGRAPVQAIIVERDRRLPALAELCAEAARAAGAFVGTGS
jgi:hypothetical protein